MAALFGVALLMSTSSGLAEPTWEVFQLTTGADLDFTPHLSGTTYVWQRNSGGAGEILMWSEGDAEPISIADTDDVSRPRLSGGRVVWETNSTGDYEIKMWEGGVVTTLTDDDFDDRHPYVGGYGIVWLSQGLDTLIYDDGKQQIPITAGEFGIDDYPSVMDDLIVWESFTIGGDVEVFCWSAGKLIQLTDSTYDDTRPETDGTTVVWQATSANGEGSEIWRWTETDGAGTFVPGGTGDDFQPDVAGDVVVFIRHDGNDFEVFLYYLGVNYQITDNDYDDFEPQIDGDRIVWEGRSEGGRHIFYAVLDGLDGGETTGACCLDLECVLLTQSACNEQDGLFRGEATLCDEDSCGVEPAGGWYTFQHDAQRTGRTDAVVPDAPARIWSLLVGEDGFDRAPPVIGPDGTIYVGAYPALVSVTAEGDLRWQDTSLLPLGPVVVRRDGNLFLPGQGLYHKLNSLDGTGFCGLGNESRFATAMDAAGNSYFTNSNAANSPWSLRRADPSCNVDWTYGSAGAVASHIALGLDGGVHVSGEFFYIKLDPADGSEAWSIPTATHPGGPAIGSDGTIYRTLDFNMLLAINPDGSEKWTHAFDNPDFAVDIVAPSIGSDGSIYVPGSLFGDSVAVVAVSSEGDERWTFVEPVVNSPLVLPLAIDGSGQILLLAEQFVIALSGADGAELWRVDIGSGDTVSTAVAIGDEGTLYVSTENGFLIAFGDGCPEEVNLAPYYTYRTVAEQGTEVAGYLIDRFESYEILADGRVVFQARIASPNTLAIFVEQLDGSFEVILREMELDGHELDAVSMPGIDAEGSLYFPAVTVDLGPVIYRDGELYLQEVPGPLNLGPLNIHGFSESFFDIDEAGHFLLLGQIADGDPLSVLRVRPATEDVEVLLSEGTVLDEFTSFNFEKDPDHRRYGNSNGSYVLADDERGLIVDGSVVLHNGDTVGEHVVSNVDRAQINANMQIHFWATHGSGNEGVFGLDGRRVGTGDIIAGFEIDTIERYDVNDDNQLAFVSQLSDGRLGVFVEQNALAVEGTTTIDGILVDEVNDEQLDQNSAGQVAFVATVAGAETVYVATAADDPPFEFRAVFAEGTSIGDLGLISAIRSIDLSGNGLLSAYVEYDLPIEVAPIQVYSISTLEGFYITDSGSFTGLIEATEGGGIRFSLVDPVTEMITPLIGVGDIIDNYEVTDLLSGELEQRLINSSGQFVAACADVSTGVFQGAIITNDEILVRTGDVIDGYELTEVFRPEITHSGQIIFIGKYGNDDTGVFNATVRLLGDDDELAEGTVRTVFGASTNDAGDLAVLLEILDIDNEIRKAVYANEVAVALEKTTILEGDSPVDQVESEIIRMNEAGQVAFVVWTYALGEKMLYVATPTGVPGAPYTYRRAAEITEVINDVSLRGFTDFRLSEAGLISVYSKKSGDYPAAMFAETSVGVFDTWEVGDLFSGLVSTSFGRAPQIDSSAAVYLIVKLAGVGPVVFIDDVPVLQDDNFVSKDAYIIETAEGEFTTLVDGDLLGSYELDFAGANERTPVVDDEGNLYVYSAVADVGQTLFRNDEPLVQLDVAGATAPVLLQAWYSDLKVFDITDGDWVLLYGKGPDDLQDGLLIVDAVAGTVTQVFADGAAIDGWIVESIDVGPLDERHVGVNRVFVVHGEGRQAVMADENVHVRDGHTVEGIILTAFSSPQDDDDVPIFIAEFDGGNGLFSASQKLFATGDEIDGHVLDVIMSHSMTDGISAFAATLDDGRIGVFRGASVVAVEQDTLIDGELVELIQPDVVRKNHSDAVAFVASTSDTGLSIFVASGPDGDLTYRRVTTVDGVEILSLDDLRLDDTGLVSFRSGDTPETMTLFREITEGEFVTLGDGDQVGGHTLDFALATPFAPRINGVGTEFLFAGVGPVGPTVFVDQAPIIHPFYQPPPDAVLTIESFWGDDYVDPNDAGAFLVYGTSEDSGVPGLLVVDTVAETITTLVVQGQVVDGFQISQIDPAEVDGFGNDGTAIYRGFDGIDYAIMTGDTVITRTGDTVDGYLIDDLDMPRLRDNGLIYYLGNRNIFRVAPDGTQTFHRGEGDTVAHQPILYIEHYEVDEQDNIAYQAALLGERSAIFFNDEPVVIQDLTTIDGMLVKQVGDGSLDRVSLNPSGQVAFVGYVQGEKDQLVRIFVATPLETMDRDGDGDVDLLDYGAFLDCLTGPDEFVSPECVVFDANDDCRCDLLDAGLLQVFFTGSE